MEVQSGLAAARAAPGQEAWRCAPGSLKLGVCYEERNIYRRQGHVRRRDERSAHRATKGERLQSGSRGVGSGGEEEGACPHINILVEMLNIVGERERPNLDLPAMFGLHNVPFRERQIYLSSLHAYCTLAERYLPYAFSSTVTRQLACSSMCTSNPSAFAPWNHKDWEEV